MSTPVSSIWPKALDLLKDELSEISYNTWIKTIEPINLNYDSVDLGVPTDFNKGILETRYSELIKNALKQVTKKEYQVNIVSPEETKNLKKESKREETVSIEKSVALLNPKYTFDTFVIGNSNVFAHAASVAVAEAPARAYNPLFLYGGVGLGKTHLMHAIAHYVLQQNPEAKVLYVSSEKFTNELINAIRDDKNEEFRNKFRKIDVLLIDDIQFIGGKERTQEEFFHTFNALYEANKQIVISSDRPPKEINTLEERLRSRFEWGLCADIQLPDVETRIAILKKKGQTENVFIPDEVFSFIADKIVSNIRELEGALNKVIAYSNLTNKEITIELCEEALKEIISNSNTRVINSVLIVDIVARYFDIRIDDFKSKKRNREIAFPRQIAMYLCREHTDLSLPKIGDDFGGRDHTTVMHAINKISTMMDDDAETKRTIDELTRSITGI